jgi:hypothetical protein
MNCHPKKPTKELPTEGPSQAARGQGLTTAEATILTTHIPQKSHPHTSTESHVATANARRPEGPMEQPSTQMEVFTTNTVGFKVVLRTMKNTVIYPSLGPSSEVITLGPVV